MLHINNRNVRGCHGSMLERIYEKIMELAPHADVFVREGCFCSPRAAVIYKVIGVSDLALWRAKQAFFEEIAPARIKKLITGNGRAAKDEVAGALIPFVGQQQYDCNDMSDAVAAGVSWLLTHGWSVKTGDNR